MSSLTCLRKYGIHVAILYLSCVFPVTHSNLPEQGQFELQFSKNQNFQFVRRALYSKTKVELYINCDSSNVGSIQIGWVIRGTTCYEEYNSLVQEDGSKDKKTSILRRYFNTPDQQMYTEMTYNTSTQLVCNTLKDYSCTNHSFVSQMCGAGFTTVTIEYPKEDTKEPIKVTQTPTPKKTNIKPMTKPAIKPMIKPAIKPMVEPSIEGDQMPRKKRVVAKVSTTVKTTDTTPETTPSSSHSEASITSTLGDTDQGVYLIVVNVVSTANTTVLVKIKHDHYGYISPIDYPLLVVYGILCAVYIVYSILWLVLLALNWKDILRLQYWIAGVIVLGLLEKAVLVSEYDSVYKTGLSVQGAVIFGALVSCSKRTLARMLIIIASVGFGIVKPRLGPMLNKVLGVGALYFVLASVGAWYNTTLPRVSTNKYELYPDAALVLLDAFICWWIFSNLITTLRTLRLRRNIVKHSVYRHFTHTLIVAVLVSVGFIIWSVMVHKRQTCIKDFSNYWLDEAFWPILFSSILLVIVILWRPTANNQRYAFSPLLDRAEDDDDEDDDEDEIVLNDAYEGMKMRGNKEKAPKKDFRTKAEEDLKWVEENIPASIADKTLGFDSDEELKQTRLEMGKME